MTSASHMIPAKEGFEVLCWVTILSHGAVCGGEHPSWQRRPMSIIRQFYHRITGTKSVCCSMRVSTA